MSEILTPTSENISRAISALRAGDVIGLPTETVYGLGGDATNPKAIAKIFTTKNRPQFNPLISHVSTFEMAFANGIFSHFAKNLVAHFWPSPLTIVVPRNSNSKICDLACAGLETIALRMPNHKIALDIIDKFGGPIAAPSANISGSISPTNAQSVYDELNGKIEIIIDGGACEIGLESTVISIIDDEIIILRKGKITIDDFEKFGAKKISIADIDDENPKSPGMLLRHYSPISPLMLNTKGKKENEVLIGFGSMDCDFNLSPNCDLAQAAANLYSMMRQADKLAPTAIKIAPIPNHGIGEAINDRLMRAASEKNAAMQ